MKDAIGCLTGIFVLPYFLFQFIVGDTLSRIFDQKSFLRQERDTRFDYIGRWQSGNHLGIFGTFGATVQNGIDEGFVVRIYYSRFQGFKRGQIETRHFGPKEDFPDIPLASKLPQNSYFSYSPTEQIIIVHLEDSMTPKSATFGTYRPDDYGNVTIHRLEPA